MDILNSVESVILPLGFRPLPELSRRQLVYARLVPYQKTRRVSQRIFAPLVQNRDGIIRWKPHPKSHPQETWGDDFYLTFAIRTEAGIEKIGSQRRVAWLPDGGWRESLLHAIQGFARQLHETDPVCNKCGGSGIYSWRGSRDHVFSGECNRCEGKGYQDWNDRQRNFGYDRKAKRQRDESGVEREHWHPWQANLEDR